MSVEYMRAADTAAEMDEIVQGIFAAMTACHCSPIAGQRQLAHAVHARIVFIRSCCKTCEILLGPEDADELTRLLTGDAGEDLREDVAGELCNMIAGGWKARRSAEGVCIGMLPPQTGIADNAAGTNECAECFRGSYAFARSRFTVRLRCSEMH